MQLSDVEKMMVTKLRKRKQTFIRWRWFSLFIGVFNIGAGTFCFVILSRLLLDPVAAAMAAFFSPIVYLFFGIGVFILADTLIHWHGKPEVDLLLKLIDDAQAGKAPATK